LIDIACSILKTERKSLHSRKEISCSILQNEGKNIELHGTICIVQKVSDFLLVSILEQVMSLKSAVTFS
jgi:hypothetical protein